MKRLILLVLVVVLVLSLGIASATGVKGKSTKVKSDRQAIERAVLSYDARHSDGTPTTDTVKVQVKVADVWAKAYSQWYDKRGVEVPSGDSEYLLRKMKGRWLIKGRCFEGAATRKGCQKIGLPVKTAKKLGIQIVSESADDIQVLK